MTNTLTCAVASCDSPADSAAVSSISNSVTTSLSNSMASGSFLTLLSTSIAQSSELDTSIANCLVVWGVTEAPITSATETGTGRFYPDWIDDSSSTCLEDGNEPIYMANNPGSWIFDSLQECCERYFKWDLNGCMNLKGSGLWYADVVNDVCVTDCDSGEGNTCAGIAGFSDNLYSDPKSCCKMELAWRFAEFCEVRASESSSLIDAKTVAKNCYHISTDT